MAERIYTIPINEAFDRFDGCPLCFLLEKLEDNMLNYSLGAAMMEPDVRIEMNKQGFCHAHLTRMAAMKNKLALALILESLLDERKAVFGSVVSGKRARKNIDASEVLNEFSASCFVCGKIRFTENRYYSNTINLWEKEPGFRKKLQEQPFFCVSHTASLLKFAKNELKAANYPVFYGDLMEIETRRFNLVKDEVSKFCVSFDHRNAGKPLGDEKYCVEKSISLLR